MSEAARIVGQGWLIVSLVSANTYQIAHAHYLGAAMVGGMISLVWYINARTAGRSTLRWGPLLYAAGAAVGTLTGMLIAQGVYG